MSTLISILSTEHGRIRREQRDIRKRDLNKAVKYGKRERCWGHRWKIEYDGMIFIVDNAMTREVTAYPSPLALAPIEPEESIKQDRTRKLLKLKLELCTSHTVLVVDNSGSMRSHDIILHRDRQVAAYSITAMEFVAEQLFNETMTNSDVVSLIEFDSDAREVFLMEPFSWTLYNKVLKRRDSRGFTSRQDHAQWDCLIGDSNYLPALEAADTALGLIDHDRCALSLFFLSDGAPTDGKKLDLTPTASKKLMIKKVTEMAEKYWEKLNVHMVGFGSSLQDFTLLENLVDAAKAAGAQAEFTYCGKAADQIGAAVSSLAHSTTLTRTHLMTRGQGKIGTKRKVQMESETGEINSYYRIIGHYRYDRDRDDFVSDFPNIPPGAMTEKRYNARQGLPKYIALGRHPFGKGAERLAFRCNLTNDQSQEFFVFDQMVAKETNLVERPADNIQFHKEFCKTQDLASYLGREFNSRLVALPFYNESATPRIEFLSCSILVLDDPEWPKRGVLVEKKLNTERFGWKKYNDNAGGLDGKYYHAPIDVEKELARMELVGEEDVIMEGDEDESEDESAEESIDETERGSSVDSDGESELINPTDYIQAFSHFTYLYTNKKVLVCDLQGVYNTDMIPPVFELTDPAIHYKSKSGKQNVFGRTDAGEAGMDLFFKTHRCTQVCKFMQLSRKNKNWRKLWKKN